MKKIIFPKKPEANFSSKYPKQNEFENQQKGKLTCFA